MSAFIGPCPTVKLTWYQWNSLSRVGSFSLLPPAICFLLRENTSFGRLSFPKHVCFVCFPYGCRGCMLWCWPPKRRCGCVQGDNLLMQFPSPFAHPPQPCRFCVRGTVCRTTHQSPVAPAALWSVNLNFSQLGWDRGPKSSCFAVLQSGPRPRSHLRKTEVPCGELGEAHEQIVHKSQRAKKHEKCSPSIKWQGQK
jgi:hypothetical protein